MSTQTTSQTETVEETEKVSPVVESSEILSSIHELQGESESIKDILDMEKAYALEVATIMKQFLDQIGRSYVLDPSLFPRLGHGVKEVILTPQGVFFLAYNNGLNVARTVDDLTPESLIKVLERILPDVKAFLTERRQKLSARATTARENCWRIEKDSQLTQSSEILPKQAIPIVIYAFNLPFDKTAKTILFSCFTEIVNRSSCPCISFQISPQGEVTSHVPKDDKICIDLLGQSSS